MENIDPLTFDQGILLIKVILGISLSSLVAIPVSCLLSSFYRSFTWRPARKRKPEQTANNEALRQLVADSLTSHELRDNTK